jgi:uncharacterized protein (DUF58 family)
VRFLRRLPLLAVAGILLVAAFSTGFAFLFYLVYLGVLVVGGSYLVTRNGLADLEAGYSVNQLQAHVGDQLRTTYTLRNTSRLPKLWLEVHNPSTLPIPLPGRAISLGTRRERSWVARVPLARRGHFRVDPLQIRTGDPFGFFEANASVGHGLTLVVYPRIERIPRWRLRAVSLEGSRSTPVRTQQTTPLATSIRPYAPGDAFNRIHWPSTARTGEIQVKEFDLEQTADVWLFVDLERRVQSGSGDDSSVEVAVRVAAAVAERALSENRAVGLTTTGAHIIHLSPDRGPRQRLKILNLLAAVDGDGSAPLVEALVAGLPLLRRGMSAVIVTPAAETAWVRPLATLRPRGIGAQVMFLDPHGFLRHDVVASGRSIDAPNIAAELASLDLGSRGVHHALAEFDVRTFVVPPAVPLGEVLVG